jgi:uncharacterized protein YcaQ
MLTLSKNGLVAHPFLVDEALVARFDLRVDRQAGVLRALSVTLEPGAPSETVERLTAELQRRADWLGLAAIHITKVR